MKAWKSWGKRGIRREKRMKRWGSAQVDVGGWAMLRDVQITPTHTPLMRQPPRAPTSSCSSCSRMACKKARRSKPEDFWSNMPAWMTFWSTFSLYLAAARIFSSTLLTVQRRSTRTSFCWPIRWALSWACKSCKKKRRWLVQMECCYGDNLQIILWSSPLHHRASLLVWGIFD